MMVILPIQFVTGTAIGYQVIDMEAILHDSGEIKYPMGVEQSWFITEHALQECFDFAVAYVKRNDPHNAGAKG